MNLPWLCSTHKITTPKNTIMTYAMYIYVKYIKQYSSYFIKDTTLITQLYLYMKVI